MSTSMPRQHRLGPTPDTVHWGYFDARLPARIEVDSGDTVVVDTVSGSLDVVPDETLYRPEHLEIVTKLKPILGAHILTGPIANYPVADSFNRARERDYSTGDIPHVFVSSVVWDLPAGAGRARRCLTRS